MTVAKVDGYSVKVALGRDGRIANGRKIDVALFLADAGRWKLAGKPSMSTRLHGNGRMTFLDSQGHQVEIKFSVTDQFSGDLSAQTIGKQAWGTNACSTRKIAEWGRMMKAPINAGLILPDLTDQPNACCKSGNMTCCSDGPVGCSSGDGKSCCT